MKRKMILLLTAAALLCLSACGAGNKTETPAETAAPAPTEAAVTPEPTPEPTPVPTPEPTPDPMTQYLRGAQVGDVLTFGAYEQDYDRKNGAEEIEWLVLEKDEGSLLLLSLKCLEIRPVNVSRSSGYNWDECTLREWLNGEFYEASFTRTEQAFIAVSDVSTLSYEGEGVCETQDKLFLLSTQEAETLVPEEYYGTEQTEYLRNTGYPGSAGPSWWLRNPGISIGGTTRGRQSICGTDGINASGEGCFVDSKKYGVRPAMRVLTEGVVLPEETAETAESTDAAETERTEEAEDVQPEAGVDPALKEELDGYEAFFDEYIAFYKDYVELPPEETSPEEMEAMTAKYLQTLAALEAIDPAALPEADAQYYEEVMSRIREKIFVDEDMIIPGDRPITG